MALLLAFRIALAAPAPAGPPSADRQPPIIFSPQIVVPAASPPTVNVQTPQPDPLKTWLPVGVAILSAAVAAFSALLAWRNQNFGFRKDRAAVIRDIRAKQAAANLLAYENNVARSVGAVLDLVERMINEVSKIRPVAAAEYQTHLEKWGVSVIADQANGERLRGEADGALFDHPQRVIFAPLFVRRGMDSIFLEAIREALSGPPGAKFELLRGSVRELKVEMRRNLEQERQAEATRWIGDITEDPFYDEIKHLIRQSAATS